MEKTKIVLSIIMVATLSNCGEDIPSVAQGKSILEEKYEKSACLKLLNFDKTNGQKSEFGGVLGYKMEYLASMELRTGCYGYFSDEKKKFWSNPTKEHSEQGDKNMKNIGYRLINAGESVQIKGVISFGKKENGWEGREFVF